MQLDKCLLEFVTQPLTTKFVFILDYMHWFWLLGIISLIKSRIIWTLNMLLVTSNASIAQWQSTGLVNQGSWVQSSLEASFIFFNRYLYLTYFNQIKFQFSIKWSIISHVKLTWQNRKILHLFLIKNNSSRPKNYQFQCFQLFQFP